MHESGVVEKTKGSNERWLYQTFAHITTVTRDGLLVVERL